MTLKQKAEGLLAISESIVACPATKHIKLGIMWMDHPNEVEFKEPSPVLAGVSEIDKIVLLRRELAMFLEELAGFGMGNDYIHFAEAKMELFILLSDLKKEEV